MSVETPVTDEGHEHAQRVDEDRQLRVDADRHGVVPRGEDDLALLLAAVLEAERGEHRADERGGDRERPDRADDAAPARREAEPETMQSRAAGTAG